LLLEPASFAPRHTLGVVRYQQERFPQGIDLITEALKRNPRVNFWITPDEANLDPEGGGLVIWDRRTPGMGIRQIQRRRKRGL
jgi:hypothetical protein